ncbi:LysE family transporter [Lutibacter citreus]|uniref:LysE family transporter n=1 Tax=Lutibacter citreus TaxID=2138210 RepID=UPI000DBE3D55|nr:LysE family transporter [Lutibacter citreus]
MGILLHFSLGFLASFLGTIPPSMLNMTAAKISINKSKFEAFKFAIGVSIIVLIQAYVAILFTKFLRGNSEFLNILHIIAIVVFTMLSIYFYNVSKKSKDSTSLVKEKKGNSFIVGLLLSTLNMFSIPFYCGVTTALDVAGWLQFSQQNIIIFVVGSAFGTFSLLFLYANYAVIVLRKAKVISKNLNLILSVLTGVLAIITLLKIL